LSFGSRSNDKALHFQELDQILSNAHIRRSSDLGAWLRQYLEFRRIRRQSEKLGVLKSLTPLHRQAV
jgi:hypothetical protein